MNAPVDLEKQSVYHLLKRWGFAESVSPELYNHAANVIKFNSRSTEDIVLGLDIVEQELLMAELAAKPNKVKLLDWLRTREHKLVMQRYDEIMAIQEGRAYIDRVTPGLTPFSGFNELANKGHIENELARFAVVPVLFGTSPMLAFSDMEKLLAFETLGRHEKAGLSFIKEIARIADVKLDMPLILASNSAIMSYKQGMSDGAAANVSDESIKTLFQSDGESSPTLTIVINILNEGLKQDSNDVSFQPDEKGQLRVYFRKFQKLMPTDMVYEGEKRDELLRVLMARGNANKGGGRLMHPSDGHLKFSGKHGSAFLRLSFINLENSNGENISCSIRILPRTSKHLKMDDLNIDPEIQEELKYYSDRKYGLILVCGPTGAGKSTTIGSMLCYHYDIHGDSLKRMSVEQPVERILPGVLPIDVSQHHYHESQGQNIDKFSGALKAILRHDPDVIFVGEVRDKETAAVSVDAANTGHLVFATTHANEPVLGFRRIASFLPKDRHFDLVNVLEAILVQRLITLVCENCGTKSEFNDDDKRKLERYARNKGINLEEFELPTHHIKPGTGCKECCCGYVGMTPVHGLLTMSPKVRELLLSNVESDWMKAQDESDSKFTLFRSAFKHFAASKIDLDSLML